MAIVSLFSSGGLQRDCLSLAGILRRRGNDVHLIAARCEDAVATENPVQVLRVTQRTNHGRDAGFARALADVTQDRFDLVAGFNKMPGLDVLYCADRSILAAPVALWKRWLPRHQTRLKLEQACFGEESRTQLLLLSVRAKCEYQAAWNTQDARITVLPPTISSERMRHDLRATEMRNRIRVSLGIAESEQVWLFVAAYPHTKGLDRLFKSVAGRTGVRILVAGVTGSDRDGGQALKLATSLGIEPSVSFLGHREDIPELMAAADVLVHPARYDMTGGVILESICSGLPVITTAACGFAEHVENARAGIVLGEPFQQQRLSEALDSLQDTAKLAEWSRNAIWYAAANDFSSGLELAADLIEDLARQRIRTR